MCGSGYPHFCCLHLCCYLLSCVCAEEKQMWASSQKCATAPSHCTLRAPVLFFCLARWDAQLTHNPHTLTDTHIQTPDVLPHSLETDHWRSRTTVAQRKKKGRKKTNKQTKKGTYTLTSPIIHCIITITISIHPSIYPRFGADSRWFKTLSQTQSCATVPEKA